MADRLWRVQVSFPLGSGVPEDAVVNVWHFDDDDDPVAAPDDTGLWITQQLDQFYSAVGPVVFANSLTGTASLKMYDMAEPEPRQAVHTSEFTFATAASDPFPGEVALTLSAAADFESGVPAARRRGRIYLGPIAQSAGTKVNHQIRPSVGAMTAVRDAADDLAAGFEHPGSPGFRLHWAIYSPRTQQLGGTIGQAFNDVQSGWVDDAFDTQRRRGCKPLSRLTFES